MEVDLKTVILGISAVVALYAVYRNTEISKKRATIDLVMHQKNDEKLQSANQVVNPILKTNRITRFADDEHKDSEERKSILIILNNYEFISTGMREGVFHFGVYKRMRYGEIKRDWECFEPFILDLRSKTKRATLFQEFEWLAKKLKKKPLRHDRK